MNGIIRISPENIITVALLSGVAYLGVIGAQKLLAVAKAKTGQ